MSNILRGQSFINKVIELTGDAENALTMAIMNGLSLTDRLPIGKDIQGSPVTNIEVVEYFTERKPATAVYKIELYELPAEFPLSF